MSGDRWWLFFKGERRTENGGGRAESGERRTEDGERKAENGNRRTESGERRLIL